MDMTFWWGINEALLDDISMLSPKKTQHQQPLLTTSRMPCEDPTKLSEIHFDDVVSNK
jgi:hypothetical protein